MAEDPPREDETAAEQARQRVLAAVDEAIAATREVADPDRAYAAAKLLVETLRQATNQAGPLHAQAAARIHEAERLSYAALGARLGVGKARAEQLVKLAARAAKPDDGAASQDA